MDERDNEKLNNSAFSGESEEFTLESILAEYKGSAYIEGDKRTPQEKLDEQTSRILRETRAGKFTEPEPEAPDEYYGGAPEAQIEAEPKHAPGPRRAPRREYEPEPRHEHEQEETPTVPEELRPEECSPERETAPDGERRRKRHLPSEFRNSFEMQRDVPEHRENDRDPARSRNADVHIHAFSDMSETEQEFFGVGKYARANSETENKENADEIVGEEKAREERAVRSRRKWQRPPAARPPRPEPEPEPEPPEPTMREAGAAYAKSVKPLKRRGFIAVVISLIMAYISAALASNMWIPEGLRTDPRISAMILLILLLAVMYIGRDVLVRGICDLFKLRAGAESLVSAACIASAADAVYIAVSGKGDMGAPFCVVAAFGMACAIIGTRYTYLGYRRTYKTAIASTAPYIVTPELDRVKDGMVLLKTQTDAAGFVSRADEEDGMAHAYAFAAPLLLVASLVLALAASAKSGMDTFFHNFAAMSGASASFAALISYGLPFASVSKVLSKAGAAIAGWSGACDIKDSIGVVVTDDDVFPAGTMELNGVRVFAGMSLSKVLTYTGSVVIASGSGLSPLFSALLKQQSCATAQIENFMCYEGGGIGATVRGEKVLVGSSGFMNLMGVRIPQNLGVKSAVYSAISGELVGVFAVNYTPVNSVQHALVMLLRTKILPLLAVRDFNMTPLMIQQKFKITTDKLDYLTVDARYKLSDESSVGPARPVAVLCREGLGPLAEVAAAGRQFRNTVIYNTLITLAGTVIGLLLTFYLSWIGAYDSMSAINMLVFMLAWLVPVLLVSGTVKRY